VRRVYLFYHFVNQYHAIVVPSSVVPQSLVRTLAAPHTLCFVYLFRHSVGLLWTRDQPVAEASTYTGQHNKHPCPERDSNPRPQQPSVHWDRHMDLYKMQLQRFPRAAADSSGPQPPRDGRRTHQCATHPLELKVSVRQRYIVRTLRNTVH
jgi:hypothetical protein